MSDSLVLVDHSLRESLGLVALVAVLFLACLVVIALGVLIDRRRRRHELREMLEAERQVLRSIAAADATRFTRTRRNGRAS